MVSLIFWALEYSPFSTCFGTFPKDFFQNKGDFSFPVYSFGFDVSFLPLLPILDTVLKNS